MLVSKMEQSGDGAVGAVTEAGVGCEWSSTPAFLTDGPSVMRFVRDKGTGLGAALCPAPSGR